MTRAFDFYFDFGSPYSFIAHKKILKLEKENAIKTQYKPILLGGLHKLSNITAAAFIESKKKYTMQDCKIIGEPTGKPLSFK